jgi:hypothetical protein
MLLHEESNTAEPKARLIAFSLPQFHPIPENNEWWGQGFTEWTNVAKAKPLFWNHYQPNLPADLGFYDLRVPDTRIAQAEMARQYGIEGFCYWHYRFAGKRLLERPFNEVLNSGEPNFPFCLAWTNDTWTEVWQGCSDKVLIKQEYPGLKDYESHFYTVLDAFTDNRYITIDEKPVFIVYHPENLPEPKIFTDFWRELATKSGLKGLYLIGIADESWVPSEHGFDASITGNPKSIFGRLSRKSRSLLEKISDRLDLKKFYLYKKLLHPIPAVLDHKYMLEFLLVKENLKFKNYPCIYPNWDNTRRSGINGWILHNSTPDLFRIHLKEAIESIADKKPDRKIIFVKSWNEWAEGNYLEPDQKFGKAYLEVISDEILNRK